MGEPIVVEPSVHNVLLDAVCYLALGDFFHVIIYFLLLLLIIPVFWVRTKKFSLETFLFLTKLVFCLFIGGLLGHLYWSEFIWNKMYYSPDYVVDFYYFFKTTEHVLTPAGWEPGWMIGEHKAQDIKDAWWTVAPVCWVISALLFLLMNIRLFMKWKSEWRSKEK